MGKYMINKSSEYCVALGWFKLQKIEKVKRAKKKVKFKNQMFWANCPSSVVLKHAHGLMANIYIKLTGIS